jgi:formate dehydrogenase subunit gamma
LANGEMKVAASKQFFDSTKNEYIGREVKRGFPRYYFPLILGIVLVEAVILVLALLDILPIHGFKIYPEAGYFSYVGASDLTRVAVTITRWFFFLLTTCVMIPVTLIILLEIIRRIIISRRGKSYSFDEDSKFLNMLDRVPAKARVTSARVEGDYIHRFDTHQKIQHILLFSSFILLAITGLLRGFPETPGFAWITAALGGSDLLRLIHDAAAFVMVADCIYHLIYIGYGYFVKHTFPYAMLPNLKDIKDIIHTSLWIFGYYKNEPVYDRFQYGQKIDYWAIFWGMPVMMVTGFIMMFPAFFAQYIDGQWIACCATAHRDEAILATSFIIIVHMYYGHLSTTAFPFNTVIFTGKMVKSKYKEWFGREYAQVTGEKIEED